MKKIFLVCLVMLSCTAQAEWVMYSETDKSIFFYDPDTIRKDGNMRRVWELSNEKLRDEKGAMSNRVRLEFDCKLERYRYLDLSAHSDPMASGKVLTVEQGSGLWTGIPPGTVSATMLNIVCAH